MELSDKSASSDEGRLFKNGVKWGVRSLTTAQFVAEQFDRCDRLASDAGTAIASKAYSSPEELEEMEERIDESMALHDCIGASDPDRVEMALCRALADDFDSAQLAQLNWAKHAASITIRPLDPAHEDFAYRSLCRDAALASLRENAVIQFRAHVCASSQVAPPAFLDWARANQVPMALRAHADELELALIPPEFPKEFTNPGPVVPFYPMILKQLGSAALEGHERE